MSIHELDQRKKYQSDGSNSAAAIDAIVPAAVTKTGGTASQAIGAMTNIDELTVSSGGAADDIIADVSTVVGQTQNAGSADKTDVDTRLAAIDLNFKNIGDQLVTQRTINTATDNALASITDDLNKAIAQLAALIANLKANGVIIA